MHRDEYLQVGVVVFQARDVYDFHTDPAFAADRVVGRVS